MSVCTSRATRQLGGERGRYYCEYHTERVLENIRNLRAHFESVAMMQSG